MVRILLDPKPELAEQHSPNSDFLDFFVQVIDRTGWLPMDAKRLYAWDSSGKHWYLGRKQFRWLVDQHRRFIAAESKQVEGR